MELIEEISLQLVLALQSLSPIFDGVSKFIVAIGSFGLIILVIPITYWLVDKKTGLILVMLFVITTFICLDLKVILQQPRPAWLGEVQPILASPTYAIPSVYAANTLALLGYLVLRFNKEWLWAASGIFVTLGGFSLMYLGLQFPIGVISGWLIGTIVLICISRLETASFPAWNKLSRSAQAGVILGISVMIVLSGVGSAALAKLSINQVAWNSYVSDSSGFVALFSIAGSFAGASFGYVLMKKRIDFATRSKSITKVWRCLLGISGLVLIYLGIDLLIGNARTTSSMPGYILHYIQFAACAFWIFCAAPWLFIKINLARLAADRSAPATPLPLS